MSERYIVIRNWERFQHYKDRRPLWIKNYLELLHDPAYLNLTMHQRGVLHGLWLEYASGRCQLPLNTASLSSRLNARVASPQLKALEKAGFIEILASSTLAKRTKTASPDKDKEKETPFIPLLEEPPKNGYKPAVELGDEEARQRVAAELRRASKEWGRVA